MPRKLPVTWVLVHGVDPCGSISLYFVRWVFGGGGGGGDFGYQYLCILFHQRSKPREKPGSSYRDMHRRLCNVVSGTAARVVR